MVPANGPVIATVAGSEVEKLPSFGTPVDPKPPDATVFTVPAAMLMHEPVIAGCPPAGPPPASEHPSRRTSVAPRFERKSTDEHRTQPPPRR